MAETYHGFISYSHAADDKLAPALQKGLQALARPWHQLRALRIFRDKTSLSANPALWATIQSALANSEYFLFLASPQAAHSRWVQQELEWWLRNRSAEKLLLVWTDGHLSWDSTKNDFDWRTTDCLPVQLRGRFSQEPLYVDLTWARDEDDLSVRNTRFRSAVLDLAAPIHGRAKDTLDGEDVRQHRRTRAGVRLGVSLIVLFAAAAAMMAYRSNQNAIRANAEARNAEAATVRASLEQRNAEAQRDEATRQANIAVARELAARSAVMVEQRGSLLPVASLLAIEAMRRYPSVEADQALRRVLSLLPKRLLEIPCAPDGPIDRGAFSPDGRVLATTTPGGVFRIWSTRTGTRFRELAANDPIRRLRLTNDHGLLLTEKGRLLAGALVGGDWREVTSHRVQDASFSSQGDVLAVLIDDRVELLAVPGFETIATYRLRTPALHVEVRNGGTEVVAWDEARADFFRGPGPPTNTMELGPFPPLFRYSPNGRYLAVIVPLAHQVTVIDVEYRRPVIFEQGKDDGVFGGNDHTFASVSPFGFATTWDLSSCDQAGIQFDLTDGTVRQQVISGDVSCRRMADVRHDGRVFRASVSPDDRAFATVSQDGTLRVWDAARGTETLRVVGEDWVDAALADDGSLVARTTNRCTVWEGHGQHEVMRIPEHDVVDGVTFSSDGTRVATTHGGGPRPREVEVWTRAHITPPVTRRLTDERVHVTSFSADDAGLLLSDGGVWNLSAGPTADRPRSRLVGVSRDGHIGVDAKGHVVRVVKRDDGRELRSRRFDETITVVAVAPSGERIAVQSVTSGLSVWDWRNDTVMRLQTSLTGIRRLAFDASGSRVAVAFEAPSPRVEVWTLPPTPAHVVLPHEDGVNSVAFDPSGRFIVTASGDRSARVWNLESTRVVAQFTHSTDVSVAAFSADGSEVASAGTVGDTDVRVWRWQPRDLIGEACARTARNLNRAEWQQYLPSSPYRPTCERTGGVPE